MTILLDVNVAIALIDNRHAMHQPAWAWFEALDNAPWATCPIVENGVIRIVCNPGYPNTVATPQAAVTSLSDLIERPGHCFWPDDLSLLTSEVVDIDGLISGSQMTDTYLLALAVSRGGRLATFDRRLSTRAVIGGPEALLIIPPYASSSMSQ